MPKDMNKITEEYAQAYQQWQLVVMQKEQFLAQLKEIENAYNELKNTKEKEVYKIAGNIMVLKSKEELEKELRSAKEVINLRVKSLEKQEKQLRDKLAELQQKLKG